MICIFYEVIKLTLNWNSHLTKYTPKKRLFDMVISPKNHDTKTCRRTIKRATI